MEANTYTLPNNLIAVLLRALEELVGTHGLNSLLNAAGLKDWIETPPAPDEERDIAFHQLSALFTTLEDLYGHKGLQSLMRQANAVVFEHVWSEHDQFNFKHDPEFQELGASQRVERGLNAFAQILAETSDILARLEWDKPGHQFHLERCPYCWNATRETSHCAAFYGLLESAVEFFAPATKVEINESECIAAGSESCVFILNLQT